MLIALCCLVLASCGAPAPRGGLGNFRPSGPWTSGHFTVGQVEGRPILIDPNGRPFYSVALVYDFGPNAGPYAGEKTWESVEWDLELVKRHGFNTINVYGQRFLDEMLTWCDKNGIAFYLRTSYTDGLELSGERREFPDFMDPEFRKAAIHNYDKLLDTVRDHPSFMALDMDQRWLFLLDWSGVKRGVEPKVGPAGIAYFPKWLAARYTDIQALNRAWGKTYHSFEDVLRDAAIVSGGRFSVLGRTPWRLDVVEYTSWTIDDFLKELCATVKAKNPGLLVTYTTEHPEVIPNPLTPRDVGIDFISPVHYNKKEYYGRDWIAAGKAIYETRWHYDMSGLPVYISETGWRTSTLDQTPPVTNYAFAKPGDEKFLAGLYLRQEALWQAMPWMLGAAYFMMYDKPPEGDFGYIREDRTEKPIAMAGRAINRLLPVAGLMPKNRASILYPRYTVAAERAGFTQFCTLLQALEYDALSALEDLASKADAKITDPAALARSRYTSDAVSEMTRRWFPFRFAPSPADAEGIVLLAGDHLELLSAADRAALAKLRTVSFTRAGIFDERYRPTPSWPLAIAGVADKTARPQSIPVDISSLCNARALGAGADFDGAKGALAPQALDMINRFGEQDSSGVRFRIAPPAGGADHVRAAGQTIPVKIENGVSEIHAVVGATDGDVVVPLKLLYDDGSEDTQYLGIAAVDWSDPQGRNGEIPVKDLAGRSRCLMHLVAPAHPVKRLKAVVLPNDPSIHLFALTLLMQPTGVDIPASVKMGDLKIEGVTRWAVFLPEDAVPAERVLARFSDGRPAVITSPDRRHVVFLFDLLSWTGQKRQISNDVKTVAAMVQRALQEVEAAR